MKTKLKFNISGSLPQVQDLLSELAFFLPDTEVFQSIVTGPTMAGSTFGLNLEIITNSEKAAEITTTVDESHLHSSDCFISRI